MAILQECPICRNKQSVKNKKCKCGSNMDSFKKQSKIKYWIQYRLPNGKQKKEFIRDPHNKKNKGTYDDALAAHGKRKSQIKEDRIMDMIPGSKDSIGKLSRWYLNQKAVKKLKTYRDVQGVINTFVAELGSLMAVELKQTIIEEYQWTRQESGLAPSTIDKEIRMIKTMVKKWFDNDKVGGRVLKAFNGIEKKMVKGENARERTITCEEYLKLIKNAFTPSFKGVLTVAYHTGMRAGEIAKLQYSYYDKKANVFKLPKEITKEKKAKTIPVTRTVKNIISKAIRCTHHDYIFYSTLNNPYDKWAFSKLFEKTCYDAEIPYGQKAKNGATFHDIRRTVKTNMVAAGIDQVYRDLILGHSLKGMDIHYIKPSVKKLVNEMNKYESWIAKKSANVTQTVTLNQKSS